MKVLGVLDGTDLETDLLRAWAESAELLVAADGAADRLLRVGVKPHVVIGDMDGMTSNPGDLLIIRDEDTESTDCDKLLRWCRREGHAEVTLVNVEGDLPDHVLSTFSSCVAYQKPVRIAFRRGIGWVFSGGQLQKNIHPGARVSLLPITKCSGVGMHGVEWPLDGADLEPGGRVSISNASTCGYVQVSVAKGSAFLFIEYPREEMPVWE